jgi:hypothetical protein
MDYKISVVFSTRKIDVNFIEHVKKTCMYKGVEVLPYENNGEYSLTELYNKGLNDVSSDIVVFCHDDILFETNNWGKKVLKAFEKNPEYGILGVAGTDHIISGMWWEIRNAMHGTVKHTDGTKVWVSKYSQNYGNELKEMIVVDGLFIAVNRTRIKNIFDTQFKGFHFYDLPFCLSNHINGVKIGLISNILILHKSVGQVNEQWGENKTLFEEIYGDQLPICLNKHNAHIIFDKDLPKIDMYVLSWNEEKIIPYFLNHYENFVNNIYVYDNKSDDNSVKLLKSHPKVTVIPYNTNNEIRDDAYLQIKNHAWKNSISKADIVIVCDMDEFLYSNDLKKSINNFYESDATVIKPTGYDMVVNDFQFNYGDKLTNLVKTGYKNNLFDKLIMFKTKNITEINYNGGCHVAAPRGDKIKLFEGEFLLLHYKRLGLKYFLNKMSTYKKRLSEFNKKHKLGYEYEFNSDKHVEDFNECLGKISDII